MSIMLSSINFLFLTSLAITSWIILCYFKQIEEQRHQGINIEFAMGNCTFVERPYEEPTLTAGGGSACAQNYDIYLNFVCIFACIYALAKVTHLTEKYIAKRVHGKFRRGDFPDDEPKNVDEYRLKMENLVVQMTYLEKQNKLLERKLCEWQIGTKVVQTEDELNTTEEATSTMRQRQPMKPIQPRNIYISDSHFHMNHRQIFVNEGNVKLGYSDLKDNGNDFTQIWQKYLEMQHCSIGNQPTTTLISNVGNKADFPNPIVMTNAEFKNESGMY